MLPPLLSRFLSEYGMVLVPLLLGGYYSVATYAEQDPSGAAGGEQLAREVIGRAGPGAKVLIVARDTQEDAAFAGTLRSRLGEAGVTVADVVRGQPADVRAALQRVARDERPDILLADFEGKDYGNWEVTGEAFGPGPARGTLPNQMHVSGYLGEGLVNSYFKGDDSEGTLTSPEFLIERKRINFLIGGGNHPGKTCINLLVDGKAALTATGRDSEHLLWHSWNVEEFAGKTARIEIVDRQKSSWGHINIDQIVQSDNPPKIVDDRDDLLARAEASVKTATAEFQKVGNQNAANRPVYHLLPPANWNNDPNGPVYYKGYYHLFYQHNPYGDNWGHMHWGHWRSRDLAHWEHQPIALWPSQSQGEEHVFSGCAAVTVKGQLMLFYTSIGKRPPEQWAAVPEDGSLVRWKKHPGNPILTEKLHGDVKIHEWRDPFVFQNDGHTFMVLGGNLNGSKGGEAVVNVYRAENDDLTEWKYLGVLFQHPDKSVKNIECPNFFKLGDRWVLIVSQGQPVQYFTGDLDGATMKFTAKTRGVMDYGNYYAPNCMADAKGRRILWGWVNGFKGGQGWNGCLTLPRVLSLAPDGTLRQTPAPELVKLRGRNPMGFANGEFPGAAPKLPYFEGDCLEINVTFEADKAEAFGMHVRGSEDGKQKTTISYEAGNLTVAGVKIPLPLAPNEKLKLEVFLDKAVMEVYAQDGRVCVTKVLDTEPKNDKAALFARESKMARLDFRVWQMQTTWEKP